MRRREFMAIIAGAPVEPEPEQPPPDVKMN
jgi:hypothetical protein